MTPDAQREALVALADVWARSPDIRLGQLLAHLGFLGEVHLGRGLGYLDDDELIAILYRHKAELEARSYDEGGLRGDRTGAAVSVSGSPMLVDTPPAADVSR